MAIGKVTETGSLVTENKSRDFHKIDLNLSQTCLGEERVGCERNSKKCFVGRLLSFKCIKVAERKLPVTCIARVGTGHTATVGESCYMIETLSTDGLKTYQKMQTWIYV